MNYWGALSATPGDAIITDFPALRRNRSTPLDWPGTLTA
jgi:hypothetical protein